MDYFVSIVVCVAFGLYVCSRSKWFLESRLGRFFFVTYYQFDFDNTAVPIKLQTPRGETLSAQESTSQFLANAQFGIVLKRLDNPRVSEFCPVALHQGAINEGSIQLPLISYANYVRQTTDSQEEVVHRITNNNNITPNAILDSGSHENTMQRDVMKLYMERSVSALQQEPKQFIESFQRLFDRLLCDPSARLSFHVFELEHALMLDQMLPTHANKKFFAVHFQNHIDTAFYVPLDIQKNATPSSASATTFLSVLSQTKPTLPRVVYSNFQHRSQDDIFTEHCNRDQRTIHIFREDKEYFEKMGKTQLGGKYGLACLSFLMLFKVVRCVVFDDEACWNLSVMHGKFVHVNPLCSVEPNWFLSRARPQSVLTTFGFWNLVLWISVVYWLLAMMCGMWLVGFSVGLLYFIIDDGRSRNKILFLLSVCLTQFPAWTHICLS